MRTISYFQARDEIQRVFLAGSDMPGPTRAVFRYLLDSAFYTGQAYGWVRHSSCGVTTIAKITGFSEKTVRVAMTMLENNGLIRRYPRPKSSGGRLPDEIKIEWSFLYLGRVPEAVGATASVDGATVSGGSEPVGATASYSSNKRVKNRQKPGQAREVAEVIPMRRSHV